MYYGSEDLISDKAEWAIVQETFPAEFRAKHPKTKFIAYVSVGEINQHDADFKNLKDVQVESNPSWPEALRVDVRKAAWQNHLNKKFKSLQAAGFQGVFLDTIDTPIYFEDRDPKKFSESKKALVQIIAQSKKQFPKGIVIANGGLPELANFQQYVDALLLEDFTTGFDFKKRKAVHSSKSTRDWKIPFVQQFQKTKKPILNLLYRDAQDDAFVASAIQDALKHQMGWFVTQVDLNQRGKMQCD